MAAMVATMIPEERRGPAYVLFTAIFRVGWFFEQRAEGGLYDLSVLSVVIVAVVAQIAGMLPILRAYSLQRDRNRLDDEH